MRFAEIILEGKKNRRDKKHTVKPRGPVSHAEPDKKKNEAVDVRSLKIAPNKPRNFVAKNAIGSGAGAHKDKKKAAKQGDVKHKKKPDLDETARMSAAVKLQRALERERAKSDASRRRGEEVMAQAKKDAEKKNVKEAGSPAQQAAIAINMKKHHKKPKSEEVDEVSPPGWGGTVKAMKKHKDIDNPWALAWSMKNKGYKSHKKDEEVEEKMDMPFAGAKVGQKAGKEGQWRNDGPSANRPARKGDLVGGM